MPADTVRANFAVTKVQVFAVAAKYLFKALSNFAEKLGLKLIFAGCELARELARSIDFTKER